MSAQAFVERIVADAALTESRTVVVRFEKVYGALKCYPVCANAFSFAEICGTLTITPRAAKLIQRLGFTIVPQDMSVEALDAFLRSA
jgi:hypothetical protein